jgi:hypothetical protein
MEAFEDHPHHLLTPREWVLPDLASQYGYFAFEFHRQLRALAAFVEHQTSPTLTDVDSPASANGPTLLNVANLQLPAQPRGGATIFEIKL